MTVFDYAQLEGLWLKAGGLHSVMSIAAAIAEAESSGRSDARNASGASGLWQILGRPPGIPGDIFDPAVNARMAVAKYKDAGDSFTPWVTYTNGAYLDSLRQGVKPDMNVPGTKDLGDLIAHTALQFIGHAYCWGGAPGPRWLGCWDCSSFANSVVGGMCKQSIPWYPHGAYNGTAHGPNTTVWLQAQGHECGPVPRAAVQPGDLMVWPTHMGMAINNTEMVSAETPANGTQVGVIDGFIPGEPLTCLRMADAGKATFTLPTFQLAGGPAIRAATQNIARSTQLVVAARMRAYQLGRFKVRV